MLKMHCIFFRDPSATQKLSQSTQKRLCPPACIAKELRSKIIGNSVKIRKEVDISEKPWKSENGAVRRVFESLLVH